MAEGKPSETIPDSKQGYKLRPPSMAECKRSVLESNVLEATLKSLGAYSTPMKEHYD